MPTLLEKTPTLTTATRRPSAMRGCRRPPRRMAVTLGAPSDAPPGRYVLLACAFAFARAFAFAFAFALARSTAFCLAVSGRHGFSFTFTRLPLTVWYLGLGFLSGQS